MLRLVDTLTRCARRLAPGAIALAAAGGAAAQIARPAPVRLAPPAVATIPARPLVGLTGLFPEYRERTRSVETLELRIDDCFEQSMNGTPLARDSAPMGGLLAYIAWLSQGVPVGTQVVGRGLRELAPPASPDVAHGKSLYAARCAMCHGVQGEGTRAGSGYAMPPLWGPDSFNTGAGMARVDTAAAFVQAKMPLTAPATLSAQDAYDIAAYFTAQPRPGFRAPPR